jgi:hypothetical protein
MTIMTIRIMLMSDYLCWRGSLIGGLIALAGAENR